MPRRYIACLSILGLLVVLAGCGQKGPLYMPEETPDSQSDDQNED